MGLRDLLLRTFVLPVWRPGPPKVEQWTCPVCGRTVERISPAWKGIWFTAEPGEVMALCARTHRAHDRRGGAPPAGDDLDGVEDWVPIVAVDPGTGSRDDPPASFVALLPPHGIAFVLDPADGRSYELRRLRDLSPSDLVGPRAATLPGEPVGRVAVSDLTFDDLRAVRVVAELGLAIGDAPPGDALEGRERPTLV